MRKAEKEEEKVRGKLMAVYSKNSAVFLLVRVLSGSDREEQMITVPLNCKEGWVNEDPMSLMARMGGNREILSVKCSKCNRPTWSSVSLGFKIAGECNC